MMHYAQIVFQAEQMGCDQETAKSFARKVITTAAILAMMPEDVLQVWCENAGNNLRTPSTVPASSRKQIINTLERLNMTKTQDNAVLVN